MELPVVNHKDYEAKLNDDNKVPIKKIDIARRKFSVTNFIFK